MGRRDVMEGREATQQGLRQLQGCGETANKGAGGGVAAMQGAKQRKYSCRVQCRGADAAAGHSAAMQIKLQERYAAMQCRARSNANKTAKCNAVVRMQLQGAMLQCK